MEIKSIPGYIFIYVYIYTILIVYNRRRENSAVVPRIKRSMTSSIF